MTEFITRGTVEISFEGGMTRDTEAGKPRFDLTEPEGIPFEKRLSTRFARLMGRGAERHGARNWETATGPDALARARSSAFRHFMQWYNGDAPEEDHAAAVMFNLMCAETFKWRLTGDESASLSPTPEAPLPPTDT